MTDIEKTTRIQEPVLIPPISLPIFHPLDPDQQPSSTVSTAPGITPSAQTSKPALDPPIPFWETLNQISRLEKAANQHGTYKAWQIESHFKEMHRLQQEEADKLKEAYQAAKDVGFWGFLEDVGSTLMSSVSLFYGFSALSSGGTAVGGALIASGVLSVSNLVFKYTDAWNWVADQVAHDHEDLKSAIKTYIPCAVGIAAAVMGAYGSYHAWNFAYLKGSDKAISILHMSGNIALGLTSLAKGRSQSHFTWSRAQISELQTIVDLVKFDLDSMAEEVKDFQQKQSETRELAAKLIEEAGNAIQSVLQPV